ncbi:hypothetical protein PROFUN_06426 [Planoprotostelium fungivorum]|uniref:Uncharacterized protein n=1 Tax=Planoprotostelium fungivorum TaxID=1890364 RepID=A0A2P6NNU3_9EUKA|nr:hypothetical protein PROFUN_06426 [Planoprotostelium fungivorum]
MTEDSPQQDKGDEGYEIVFKGGLLSIIDQNLTDFSPSFGEKYGTHTKQLDLSYNNIMQITHLQRFEKINQLVLDNNQLQSKQEFPKNNNLQTLWVNNNEIADLREFIECVRKAYPNLTYLSMMKNPACPNYFVGKDAEDYQRYRYFVLHKLRKLKFLDATPVNEKERKEAIRVGEYMVPAKPVVKATSPPIERETAGGAHEEETHQGEIKGKARIGVASYVYYGKHSEGNRFIMNNDL